jgi:hypothetical protein
VSDKPSEKAIEATLQVIADELMRLHPEWEVRVQAPGEPLPPGAVALPAADVEAVLGPSAGDRRGDDDLGE